MLSMLENENSTILLKLKVLSLILILYGCAVNMHNIYSQNTMFLKYLLHYLFTKIHINDPCHHNHYLYHHYQL